jgi:hypothetical protein
MKGEFMRNKLIAVLIGLTLLLGGGTVGVGELRADSQPAKVQKPALPKVIKKSGNTDEYVLVMSKDNNVCKNMLNLFNRDLQKYKEVKYESYPEFDAIKWQIGGFAFKNNGDGIKDGKGNKFAKIDINNDGKNETVLNYDICYRGVCGNGLFVFSDSAIDFSKSIEYTVEETKAFSGIQITPFWNYDLRKDRIPEKYLKKYKEGNDRLRGVLEINPFFFKNTYYVSIAEIYGVKYYSSGVVTGEVPGTGPIWHIITKYTDQQIEIDAEHRTSRLEHVCYFQLMQQKNKPMKGE